MSKTKLGIGIILFSLLVSLVIVSQPAHAQTVVNVTLLYGWNGTAWTPMKTDSTGILQTNINVTALKNLFPKADNTYDLGSSALRWRAIYGMQEALGLSTSPTSTLDISGNISITGSTNNSINTFFIDATNNRVGIGTTSPQQDLNVVGQANITGRIILNGTTLIRGVSYTWPSADGSSSQALTTNGAGVLSWATAALTGWTMSGGNLYNSTSNVNVGIGTSSPASLLHVTGSATNLLNVSNSTYSSLSVNTSGAFIGGVAIEQNANVTVFTANGTWTKPAGAKLVRVIVIGGGGGGGGGHSAGGVANGNPGTGGGGGALVIRDFDPSVIGATETIAVGSGGAGGIADGNGGAGGTSAFGSHVYAYGGGRGVFASYGYGGAGGGGAASVGGSGTDPAGTGGDPGGGGAGNSGAGNNSNAFGGGGGGGDGGYSAGNAVYGGGGGSGRNSAGAAGAGGSSLFCAGGGGAGGFDTASDTPYAAGAGGAHGSFTAGGGGTAGGTTGQAGGAGTSRSGTGKCGDGGGGGGSNSGAGNSGAGGAGGVPGGGGGGGGGTHTGAAAGGGAGGGGEVIVITFF